VLHGDTFAEIRQLFKATLCFSNFTELQLQIPTSPTHDTITGYYLPTRLHVRHPPDTIHT